MKRNKWKKKNNQFLMHPWVSGIGTGLLVFIITTIISSKVTAVIQKINFFQGFLAVVKFLGRIVKFAFTFKIPIWTVILIFIGIFFVLFVISVLSNKKPIQEPDWKKYTSMGYQDNLYTWDYETYSGETKINNLRPICKNCKCELSYSDSGNNRGYYCPNCHSVYHHWIKDTEVLKDLEKIIIHKIETGDYKQYIEKGPNQ